ncbi:MAG: TIM barrel protein [Rhodospirillaceae bacterium]|jgi:hydroxypyruvate isomerase
MPRFSANASMIFLEYDLLDRFAVAAREGFEAIELQFPYDTPAADLKDAKEDSGLEIAGINIPVGDLSTGGRGNASIPGKEDEFKASVEVAYEYAEVCRPRTMNVLPGFPPLDEFEREQCLDVLAGNLCVAAEGLQELGVKVMTEAVNTVERPGFLLDHTWQALDVIDRAGHENLAIEYDIYHMQIMEGDLVNTMRETLPRIGHIQFADTPGRHEPGTGEINFPYIFEAVDEMGWDGFLGAEYIPTGRTEDCLGWMPGR